MLNVGIFSGYYPFTIDETIEALKKQGLMTVQLDVGFLDFPELCDKMGVAPHLTKEKAVFIRNKFRDANIQISSIYGYINLLAPDPVQREKNIAYIKSILKHARDLGSPYVVTETGTYSLEHDYAYHPKNHEEETYVEIREIIKDLVAYAKKYDATLLIEPYVNNVIHTVEKTKRIFDELGTENFGLLMDPCNYFDEQNIDKMDDVLNEIFDQLDEHIYIAHAKDVCRSDVSYDKEEATKDAESSHTYRGSGGIGLPAVGLGVLNHELYLKRLSRNHPNIPIIIEHLEMADIPRAKQFLDQKLKEVGV